jgi:hypothetical protein
MEAFTIRDLTLVSAQLFMGFSAHANIVSQSPSKTRSSRHLRSVRVRAPSDIGFALL